jgi:hypothetical protein
MGLSATGTVMNVRDVARMAALRLVRWTRRRGPALIVAAVVNALILTGMAISIRPKLLSSERAIQVWLVPPLHFERSPKHPEHSPLPSAQPRPHEAPILAPTPTAFPSPIVIPPPPPRAPTAAAPAPGRWTVQPNGAGSLVDNPSAAHALRAQQACSSGELEHMTTEERAKCLERLGRYVPKKDNPFDRDAPRDPDGSFGRAADAIEYRRKPMNKAHIGDCDLDAPGRNFGRGCYNDTAKPPH